MATTGTTGIFLRYEGFISHARNRVPDSAYFETHHIVPKSEGGGDTADNLVALSAREHFLAHWMLFRMYRTPAAARAFKLMSNSSGAKRGRDYAAAKLVMSLSMRGDANVSRRPDVREKLRANAVSPFAGKKRPEHAALMRARGVMLGDKNPCYGKGDRQRGGKNPAARAVTGVHSSHGSAVWATATEAALSLGVSLQAVVQAVKNNHRSKGWSLEYAA